jgi:hypothetical protein
MASRSRGRRARHRSAAPAEDFGRSVFINCPFDATYRPLFRALVFTVCDAGFHARCALEADDSGEVRLDKILKIIRACRLSIHDISRTELDASSKLPRFNMPFELGLDLGARKYGGPPLQGKVLLVLDRERYRFQKFISDIAGQDIKAHDGKPAEIVHVVRDWLRTSGRAKAGVPGQREIARRLAVFEKDLPRLCERLGVEIESLIFVELNKLILEFLKEQGR